MTKDIQPGRYRHFKGREYEVLCIATHSETLEPMVVYKHFTAKAACGCVQPPCGTKPSNVTVKTYQRFTYLGDKTTP